MDSQDYLKIEIRVNDEQQGEIVAAMLSAMDFDAFEYEDGCQKCYIQKPLFDEKAFGEAFADLQLMLGCPDLTWSAESMPAVNWNSEWEQSGFTPIECGAYVVRPVDFPYEGALEPLYLQPQMAFGTGHHHTTYMMMQAMQDNADAIRGGSVMDLGCGTGVLGILAAKLGAAKVSAIDIDAVAVRSALENVRLNGLDFPVICSDASSLERDSYDVLLANIHRNIIIADMPRYAEAVREGGLLLLSGFLQDDVADILEAAREHGFMPFGTCSESVRTREGWFCLTLQKSWHRD